MSKSLIKFFSPFTPTTLFSGQDQKFQTRLNASKFGLNFSSDLIKLGLRVLSPFSVVQCCKSGSFFGWGSGLGRIRA